jgi:hypothetical protein
VPRNLKIAFGILAVAVLVGLLSLRGLHRRIEQLGDIQSSDEQLRRDLLAPKISTSTDTRVKAAIFWAAGPDHTAPVEIEMALSADPVQRAKQVLQELIKDPPTPEQRTLPANTALAGLYILPDGTAIADFSDALSSEMPSGILSEGMAVDSIARTLESNVNTLRRLKILIHGQEVETLAGHLDLTGFFDLNPPALPPVAGAPPAAQTTTATGSSANPRR